MSGGGTDFAGILRMLAANHRTGTLQLSGEGFTADLAFVNGRIVRVETRTGSAWPLGEILRELRLVSPDQLERALRHAARKEVPPESFLVDRGWVSMSILKRYRERLNLASLLDLAMRTGFRAELHPHSVEEIAPREWDAEIPVPYALKEIGRRIQSMRSVNIPLPPAEARFQKVPEAIPYILGDLGSEISSGGTSAGMPVQLTPTEKRVFFFCNGRIQFRNMALITGLPTEQVAQILHKLLSMGAISPAEKAAPGEALGGALQRVGRGVSAFLGGVAVAGLLAFVGYQAWMWSMQPRAYPPRFDAQRFYAEAYGASFREVQAALFGYFTNQGVYPETLVDLIDGGYLGPHMLRPPLTSQNLEYTSVEQGLAYRLQIRQPQRPPVGAPPAPSTAPAAAVSPTEANAPADIAPAEAPEEAPGDDPAPAPAPADDGGDAPAPGEAAGSP